MATAPSSSAVDSSSSTNKPIVFVLGGPGSGKGTHCAKIVPEIGYEHISVGDLLREVVKSGSEHGQKVEEIMKQGKLVPPEITVTVLKNAMDSIKDKVGFLIDGFPRDLRQCEAFRTQVGECRAVLVLDCSEEVMMKRILGRGSDRVDDNEASIKKRLATHKESTLPVIQYYEKLGKVHTINSGRSIDEVHVDIQAFFKKLAEN